MTDITPDQARELLDGATPGPWRSEYDNEIIETNTSTVLYNTDGAVGWGHNIEHDVPLIAAAPDLAQTIAGMTEEWGVERDHPWSAYVDGKAARGITWIGDEARARKACATPPRGGNPRLVRRLVGPVEEPEGGA